MLLGTLLMTLQNDYILLHHIVVLPFEVATPSSIGAGIEVWTWLIASKPNIEVALASEILEAWTDTIKQEKGLFSKTLK